VTSLNGEPEPGVFVEALGKDSCSMYQEESKTEQNGKYRIRGLQVGNRGICCSMYKLCGVLYKDLNKTVLIYELHN